MQEHQLKTQSNRNQRITQQAQKQKARCCTWGGAGWQRRPEGSGFALTFFVSFLGQAKKEKDKTATGL